MILLDDCSTDDSREILLSYKGNQHVSHVVFNKENSGSPFKQWEKGIQLAKGKWVWIAESDDWAEPDFLERMVHACDENSQCGFAYCRSFRTDERGTLLWAVPDEKASIIHKGEVFICEVLSCYNAAVNVSACLFKHSLFQFEKVSLYENMRFCGDWFFYVLLAEQADVMEIKSPLNYCRRHGKNISERAEAQGLSLIEGADVLDYILNKYYVKTTYYSRFWGRQWAKYEKMWNYSDKTNSAIRTRFKSGHRSIIIYHDIYVVRNCFRKWQK